MLYAVPKSEIVKNYVLSEKAVVAREHILNRLGIEKTNRYCTKTEYHWNNIFLNTIEDNHPKNFGFLRNKLVIIDYDDIVKDFIVKHKNEVKKNWNEINQCIINLE